MGELYGFEVATTIFDFPPTLFPTRWVRGIHAASSFNVRTRTHSKPASLTEQLKRHECRAPPSEW
jgi:hypothetical protein